MDYPFLEVDAFLYWRGQGKSSSHRKDTFRVFCKEAKIFTTNDYSASTIMPRKSRPSPVKCAEEVAKIKTPFSKAKRNPR
jgi:hypothetical protein